MQKEPPWEDMYNDTWMQIEESDEESDTEGVGMAPDNSRVKKS